MYTQLQQTPTDLAEDIAGAEMLHRPYTETDVRVRIKGSRKRETLLELGRTSRLSHAYPDPIRDSALSLPPPSISSCSLGPTTPRSPGPHQNPGYIPPQSPSNYFSS